MSNLIPGNQKHLTLDNRVFIEKRLDQNMSMTDMSSQKALHIFMQQKMHFLQ